MIRRGSIARLMCQELWARYRQLLPFLSSTDRKKTWCEAQTLPQCPTRRWIAHRARSLNRNVQKSLRPRHPAFRLQDGPIQMLLVRLRNPRQTSRVRWVGALSRRRVQHMLQHWILSNRPLMSSSNPYRSDLFRVSSRLVFQWTSWLIALLRCLWLPKTRR